MKPSCQIVLRLLREHNHVTTHDFLTAGAGSRFGARIGELRALGYAIGEERLKGDRRGSRYWLVAQPEVERVDVSSERNQEHRGVHAPRDNGVDVGSLSFEGALFAAEVGRAA